MKMKKLLTLAMIAIMLVSTLGGCGSKHATKSKKSDSEVPEIELTETYAMILPSSENAYDERIAGGFEDVMKQAGKQYVIERADKNPAKEQTEFVKGLIDERVSCIAISPSDADALKDVLKEAMKAGIDVCSFDAPTTPDSRELFINQTGTEQIAVTLMDAVLDISGGAGEWAILSSQSTAANQNKWIDAMHEMMKDDKYQKLEMVEIAYGDDQYQKTYDQTKSLLQNYPDLKVILVPTTNAITAVCEAVRDADASVKVTGFGLPSEMLDFVGGNNICPYFYLWNPIELGTLTAYVSIALHQGIITGELGERFKAGSSGEYEVTEAQDEGTEVIVGYPYKFDRSNINEWKDIF